MVPVATQLFSFVHGQVGIALNKISAASVFGRKRNTDTGSNKIFFTADKKWLRECSNNFFCNFFSFFGGTDIRKNDNELIATHTGEDIAVANASAEATGGFAQDIVATAVAQAVVDVLESVQVNAHHGSLAMVTGRTFQCDIEMFQHQDTIGQSCQVVVVCLT